MITITGNGHLTRDIELRHTRGGRSVATLRVASDRRDRPGTRPRRPYCYHMPMARTQTLVQLSDELLDRLDRYRAREGRSRSEVVREAIERYLAADREAEIDRLLVDAYTRRPPDDIWGDRAAKQMISAEPW